MPELFFTRIKKMRFCAVTELVCILLLIVALGLLVQALFVDASGFAVAGLFGVACASALGIAWCLLIQKKERVTGACYEVSIPIGEYQTAAAALGAAEVQENTCVSFDRRNGIKIRTLLQYCSEFEPSVASVQRKKANAIINKQYHVSASVSLYEALRSMRINLIVCDKGNRQLMSWINHNVVTLLKRNEAIVQAAIVLDENKLLFPACVDNLSLAELKRYETAALLLAESLNVEKWDKQRKPGVSDLEQKL